MRSSAASTGALRLALTAALLALSSGYASAQAPEPRARAELTGASVVVGQPMRLQVEVLVPSFFGGAPRWDTPEVPGAVVLFDDRGTNFTEREGRATWAGQSRAFVIYAQEPGIVEVPPIPVSVRWRGQDGLTESTVSTQPLRFEATIPAAAAGVEHFVAAEALTVTQDLDRSPDTLRVGEAFSRAITVEVLGTLSMVIPPVSFAPVDGLAVYPAPPRVSDSGGERGSPVSGSRVESASYVAQEEGTVFVPPVSIQWWDWSAGALREATAPGLEVVVVPNPDLVAEIELPADSVDALEGTAPGPTSVSFRDVLQRWGVPAAVLVALLFTGGRLARRYTRGWGARRQAARTRRTESEAAHFRRFETAARSGDAPAAANALSAWLARWDGAPASGSTSAFAEATGDPTLVAEVEALTARLYGRNDPGQAEAWSGAALVKAVARARAAHVRAERRAGRPGSRRAPAPLEALNP